MKTALTIAGSDSGAGAGIQADLKTFAAHGVYGVSAITAITAQNTRGVAATFPLPVEVVRSQIETLAADIRLDVTKIGMLSTGAIVEAVAAAVRELDLPRVVVDPVMLSSTGAPLLDEEGVAALRAELLPRSSVVTPNVAESEVLLGMSIRSVADAIEAARRIARETRAGAVIVKGGHLPTPEAVDVVFDGKQVRELRGPRVDGEAPHGTGCTFASALAAHLALGRSLFDAAAEAKAYVYGAMKGSVAIGQGRRVLDHGWTSRRGTKL